MAATKRIGIVLSVSSKGDFATGRMVLYSDSPVMVGRRTEICPMTQTNPGVHPCPLTALIF